MPVPEQQQLAALLYNNLGLTIAHECLPTGIALLRRAVALNPDLDVNRVNLSAFLVSAGDDEEAAALLAAVVKQNPSNSVAWDILGCIATRKGDLDEAIACYVRAVAAEPGNHQRRCNLAFSYLRAGDFARGWPLYESRAHLGGVVRIEAPGVPQWQGETCRHIYVYAEQGAGDKIQFSRFLPWVKDHCEKLTFATDAQTTTLLWGYANAGVCDIVLGGSPIENADYQVAMGRLPALYGITADRVPPDPGLLQVAPTSDMLSAPGQLKIGIVWAGNPLHPNDDVRSMRFEDLLPLTTDPRNSIFSLQCGKRAADLTVARAQRLMTDLSGLIEGDWSHTAAAVAQMDLIVTIDSAVAHLAGALGKPCCLMVSRNSDWRWLWGRDDTPWYPSVRIFRQDKVFDWKPVVKRVGAAIAAIHDQQAPAAPLAATPPPPPDYEPDVVAVLRRVLRPGDTMIDVGANVGLHTVIASHLVGPAGKVLAFEPGENNLPALRTAIAHRANVEVIGRPASNAAEDVTFYLNADCGGGNALWNPADWPYNPESALHPHPVTLRATTIDTELWHRDISAVRLIKVDTEGAEQRVLEGASGLLRDHRCPFIVAELHEFGLERLGCSQQSLRAMMEQHGYSTWAIYVDGTIPSLVPPGTEMRGRFILNMLFATPEDVGAAWPSIDISSTRIRAMQCYGYEPAAAA